MLQIGELICNNEFFLIIKDGLSDKIYKYCIIMDNRKYYTQLKFQ